LRANNLDFAARVAMIRLDFFIRFPVTDLAAAAYNSISRPLRRWGEKHENAIGE
jgi:hypothetical protein